MIDDPIVAHRSTILASRPRRAAGRVVNMGRTVSGRVRAVTGFMPRVLRRKTRRRLYLRPHRNKSESESEAHPCRSSERFTAMFRD
jgi:hypothetical protein